MYVLTDDEVLCVSGGSDATYAAGEAAGKEAGKVVMKAAKIVATVSGIVALAIVLS